MQARYKSFHESPGWKTQSMTWTIVDIMIAGRSNVVYVWKNGDLQSSKCISNRMFLELGATIAAAGIMWLDDGLCKDETHQKGGCDVTY